MSKQRKPRDKRLYWRGGKLWCRVPGPGGRIVRKATRCTDELAATARADELERRYANPRDAAAQAATLEGGVRALLEDMERRGRRPSTIAIAAQKLGHFIRIWGPRMPLAEIASKGPDLVNDYVDKRQKETVTRFTISKELQHLGMMLKVARFLGNFPRDPKEILPPFFGRGGHRPRQGKLTREQAQTLLEEFDAHRAAHLAFILGTGARRSEAARAQWADIHLDVESNLGWVHVRGTKTELADDDVPITSISAKWVYYARDHSPTRMPNHPMFLPWQNLTRDLAAACLRAGLPRITPNDLRRSFGSWHRDAGVAKEYVSKLLRHATATLTETTYAKLSAPALSAIVSQQIAVPNLYPDGGSGGSKEAPRNSRTLEKTRATRENRTHDLRFTKPRAARVSRGTKLGIERASKKIGVLNVYRGALLGVLQARAAHVSP